VYINFDRIGEKKKLLGHPRSRWEDNIRIDLKQSGGLRTPFVSVEEPVAVSCEYGDYPSKAINPLKTKRICFI
jgi:hypothetical protein